METEGLRICLLWIFTQVVTQLHVNMEKELRTACHAPNEKIDRVLKIPNDLVSTYEASPQALKNGRN
ncbi:hypothetical protein Vadar_000443 [Vaccinium darrowii]|uniref:Uncharacterized protein n=1 Tax=Vaccinium darrowii TaxID=229202 RepID=A0ACB7X784_9ERIC|nr:hypothetical protein Vadar_000443 [Vaccinium darrowii]